MKPPFPGEDFKDQDWGCGWGGRRRSSDFSGRYAYFLG